MSSRPSTRPVPQAPAPQKLNDGRTPAVKHGLADLSDEDTEDEIVILKKPDSGEPVIEEVAIKKKVVNRQKPLNEDLLTSPDGMLRVYEEFPKACKFHGRGSEAKDLKKLITLYKEWAFQLHPGIAFQDFLSKCETLGAKGKVRNTLQNLRDIERDRYVLEVLGIKSNNYNEEDVEFVPQNHSNGQSGQSQHSTHSYPNAPAAAAPPSMMMTEVDMEDLMARAAEEAEASYLASQIMQSQALTVEQQRVTQSSGGGDNVHTQVTQDKTLHTQTTTSGIDDMFGEDSEDEVDHRMSYEDRMEEEHVEEQEEEEEAVVAPVRRVVTKEKSAAAGRSEDDDEDEFEE